MYAPTIQKRVEERVGERGLAPQLATITSRASCSYAGAAKQAKKLTRLNFISHDLLPDHLIDAVRLNSQGA